MKKDKVSSALVNQARQSGYIYQRFFTLLVSLLVFAASTWLAYTQKPYSDPHVPNSLVDKFLYPIEHNAFQRLPKISDELNSVFALPNTNKVWAVGDNGLIIHSPDGGLNWHQQIFPDNQSQHTSHLPIQNNQRQNLHDYFVSSAIAGENLTNLSKQKKSQNNGPLKKQVTNINNNKQDSITIQLEIKPDLSSVFFINKYFGWIVGTSGTIITTQDGGQHWTKQKSPTTNSLSSVTFTNFDFGWAAGMNGAIISTTDGGKHWTKQASLTTEWLNSVTFTDQYNGWAVGAYGTIIATQNGGKDWTKQDSLTTDWLFSVAFTDTDHGWVVGAYGTIITTQDGGQHWTKQKSPTTNSLNSVTFTDTDHGWAISEHGTIISTQDGGKDWTKQKSPTKDRLNSVTFTDIDHGWVVGWNGTIINTQDGGNNWVEPNSPTSELLLSVTFTDAHHGWAVGTKGIIISTKDGGKTWSKQVSQTTHTLFSVAFTDAEHGWAVGSKGTIIVTQDGGKHWTKQVSLTTEGLNSVTFIDRNIGWAVGNKGIIISTIDGGKHWIKQDNLNTKMWLNSVVFVDPGHGWAVGSNGAIIATQNGGKQWAKQISPSSPSFNSITFTDTNNGWAVGSEGTIIVTQDGGKQWVNQDSQTTHSLKSVNFTNPDHGWAVGDFGIIIVTQDGGNQWVNQEIQTTNWLYSVSLIDSEHGWAVGSLGTIINSKDGGKTWSSPEYKRYPAGWYYLVCLVLLAGPLYWLLRSRIQQTSKQDTITDLLASDRPLQSGDPDPLGFKEIAQGLSRFLRNPRTEPPLTIAITGEWGTGKSSLMNLLYDDLKQQGFSTVWFNAWHHQKSEQLLATMFANIRRQAIPGWFRISGLRPVGLLFRLRLLWRRSRQHWFVFLVLVLLLSVLFAYLCTSNWHFSPLLHWLDSQLTTVSRQLKIVFALGATAGTLLPLFVFFKSLQGFALNPLKLMTVQATEGKQSFSIDPGARYQFAREFQDVTSSLDLGRMIIFIDDLDRCSKEHVLDVLEAINFLVSSGQCYIILGMSREWVQICVGLGFKELATESFSNHGESSDLNGDSADLNAVKHRRIFALQYLEKLINIEVPVPVLDETKARQLTTPEIKQVSISAFDTLSHKTARFLRNNWATAVIISVIALGGYLGWLLKIPDPS